METRRVAAGVVVCTNKEAHIDAFAKIDVVDGLRLINFAEARRRHRVRVAVTSELKDVGAIEIERFLFSRDTARTAKLK